MTLHQSLPVALQCRMSALEGELMSVVHRGKIVPSDLTTAVLKVRKFSAESRQANSSVHPQYGRVPGALKMTANIIWKFNDTRNDLWREVITALGLSTGAAVALGFSRFAYGLLLPSMRADLGWTYVESGALNTALARARAPKRGLRPRKCHIRHGGTAFSGRVAAPP
jgi:hypothetical protein